MDEFFSHAVSPRGVSKAFGLWVTALIGVVVFLNSPALGTEKMIPSRNSTALDAYEELIKSRHTSRVILSSDRMTSIQPNYGVRECLNALHWRWHVRIDEHL